MLFFFLRSSAPALVEKGKGNEEGAGRGLKR
jgi:hypothetical protein